MANDGVASLCLYFVNEDDPFINYESVPAAVSAPLYPLHYALCLMLQYSAFRIPPSLRGVGPFGPYGPEAEF
jgi:hypothetical protein